MSENTTATVETVETETVETTQNEAILALVAKATERYNEANAIANRVAKSQGSQAKEIKEVRDTSDVPELVKFREWLDTMLTKINEETEKANAFILSKGLVQGVEPMTEDELKTAKEEHKAKKSDADETWNAAKKVADILGEVMPAKPEVLTLKGKAAGSGGSGTGGRRLRFAKVTVNGEEVKNLAAVAAKIKAKTKKSVTATDLQKALFETVGTDDMSKINDTNFAWSETDEEGVNHSFDIVVYPKHDTEDNGHETEVEATESE